THVENDAEPRFAAHHALIRLCGSIQRINFVHRLHAIRRTELQRVLQINRCSGVPALHRPLASAEQNGVTETRPAAPIPIRTPFGARPPSTAVIASALVTVAITTFAPPSLVSSSAGFFSCLLM